MKRMILLVVVIMGAMVSSACTDFMGSGGGCRSAYRGHDPCPSEGGGGPSTRP
jgi:hypothetical protein